MFFSSTSSPLIASSVAGRLRLRHEALRQPQRLQVLAQHLSACPAVTGVQAKPQAASIVVYYDCAQWSVAHSCQQIETLVREVLPELVTSSAPAEPTSAPMSAPMSAPLPPPHGHGHGQRKHRKHRTRHANRWAKRVMLGSLALSMLLALRGAKRGHALTGLVFLHALGLHLWVHRRGLLK